jgi:uncharacterized UPF0160 family protein
MKTVATHSGSFHADDVFAVATFQLVFGVDALKIVRTRDEANIASADIVVDVGAIYDVASFRFDHHQNGAPIRENGIPCAAFGLVWKTFGEQVCGNKVIADEIEEILVVPVDAGDSGVLITSPKFEGITEFDVFRVIRSFLPPWGSDRNIDDAFSEAVTFARELLSRLIERGRANLAMESYVDEVYAQSLDKAVLVYEKGVSPAMCIKYPDVQVVVSPDDNGNWTATAVRKSFDTFESRVKFQLSWAGLRDDELSTVSGIEGMVFSHKGCFFVVAKTKEAVLEAVKGTV